MSSFMIADYFQIMNTAISHLEMLEEQSPRKKRLDIALLICLLVAGAVNYFLPDKLFFAAVVITLFIIISFDRSSVYTSALHILFPVFLLIAIGMLAGIRNSRIDFYRDIFIFSKNIFYLLIGIALSRFIKNMRDFFRYFLLLGFCASLLHLGTIAMNFNSGLSLVQIRRLAGLSNSLEALMISFCIASFISKSFKSVIGPLNGIGKLMFIVISTSFVLYFSRTMIVMVAVVCAFLINIIFIRKFLSKQNLRLLRPALVFSSLIYIAYIGALFFPENSPIHTLAVKFRNIPDEVSWDAKRNLGSTREEIQANWRGYEAYQGLQKFKDGNTTQKVFGFGFGSRVNLDLIMKLSGEDYETIPVLHNEYVMLLVKSGIFGLLLYLMFIYQFRFRSISNNQANLPELYYSYQVLSALALATLLNTFVGFGLVNLKNTAVPIFIGFFWGNIQRHLFQIKRASIIGNRVELSGTS